MIYSVNDLIKINSNFEKQSLFSRKTLHQMKLFILSLGLISVIPLVIIMAHNFVIHHLKIFLNYSYLNNYLLFNIII